MSNLDGSLTISPTTGAVVASLNTANANTYTAMQTFGYNNGSSSTVTTAIGAVAQLTNANVAAGAVTNYYGIECLALTGGGSTPTNNFCLNNTTERRRSFLLALRCSAVQGLM